MPSLTGKYIEDWIVQSVGYSQDDGRVNINVRATRLLGAGTPMNEPAAEIFTAFAKSQKLIGPNATLEAWDSYAWSLPGEAEQRRADTLSNGEYNPTAAAAFRASGDSFN